MKLSEIKQILADQGLKLTKSLGQNFMHDGNQLRRMLDAAALEPEDEVLEIGPGLGPLTEMLLPKVKRVLAVEKDPRLCAILSQRLAGAQNLELVHADAMDYLAEKTAWRAWKLASNLPYSVASRLLVLLALSGDGPKRVTVTLQFEVAQRLRASAGDPEYGLLSLLVQQAYEPVSVFKIPASCFFPEPEVDSACITLVRRGPMPLSEKERRFYERLARLSFSQRRKTMLKLLKNFAPATQLHEAFQQAGISANARAEAVKLEQFFSLARYFAHEA